MGEALHYNRTCILATQLTAIPASLPTLLRQNHAEQDIARLFDVRLEEVRRWLQLLDQFGIDPHNHAVELLSVAGIRSQLSVSGDWLSEICINPIVSSTNELALMLAPQQPGLYLAEAQSAGRGRRGRHWLSPWGNLFFSLAWRAPIQQPTYPLSLLVGAATALVAEECGIPRVELKWPNDLRIEGAKFAGILIETDTNSLWVAGIGINLTPPESTEQIDQRIGSISNYVSAPPSRNTLAALLCDKLYPLLSGQPGAVEMLLQSWRARDCCLDKPVRLLQGEQQKLHGIARGIDDAGNLLLETESKSIQRIHSGELSLRLDETP